MCCSPDFLIRRRVSNSMYKAALASVLSECGRPMEVSDLRLFRTCMHAGARHEWEMQGVCVQAQMDNSRAAREDLSADCAKVCTKCFVGVQPNMVRRIASEPCRMDASHCQVRKRGEQKKRRRQ